MTRTLRGLLALLLLLAGTGAPEAATVEGRLLRAARIGHHLVLEPSPEGPRIAARPVAAVAGVTGEATPTLPVLLVGDPDGVRLAALGIRVRSRGAGVVTADVPAGVVPRLAAIPGLGAARLAAPVFPLLDHLVPEVSVDGLRMRVGDDWTGTTGEGTILGLVDSGLDTAHDDFRRADGSTRVLAHWAQGDASGAPPAGFGYGTLRTATEIDAGDPVAPDLDAHGTHVAGIAAGDGSATGNGEAPYRYPGIAPGADLVVVGAELDEAAILDGARFVMEEATRQGRPVVLNLSVGTQFGPHDGTSPFDRGIADLLGPGRLAVASAGNEGDRRIHGEILVPPGGTATAEFTVFDVLGFFPFHVVWIDAFHTDSLAVTVITPGGIRLGPFANGTALPDSVTGEGTVFVSHTDYPGGGNVELQVTLSDYDPALGDGGLGQADRAAPGTWRLEVTDLGGAGGELDLWLPLVYGHTAAWKDGTHDPAEEVSSPATAPGVIAVGCYNNRPCWPSELGGEECSTRPPEDTTPGLLTWFSSRGPTRDDRQKPDVVAPGLAVMAARSAGASPEASGALGLPRTGDPDGVHMVQAGTSQSAPVVSGLLALALASRPDLGPTEAAEALAATARVDAETGAAWNGWGGHGKVDAAAFLGVVPAVPGRLAATGDGNGVTLAFAAAPEDGIVGFRLEREAGGTWRELARFSGPGPHEFLDPGGRPGDRYRVLAERRDGAVRPWAEASAVGTGPGVLRAAPNPFRDTVRLRLGAPAGPGGTRLVIHDVTGRVRRSLRVAPGTDAVSWDGLDDGGRPVASGIYWVRRPGATGNSLAIVRTTAP